MNKQWFYSRATFALAASSPIEYRLFGDPLDEWTFEGKVVRMLLSVNLVLGEGYGGTLSSRAGIGLILKPQTDLASVMPVWSPLTGSHADKKWLWRQMYRLPMGSPGSNIQVDLNGEPYHLDWPIYGGKGVNIKDDNALWLVGDWNDGMGRLDINVHYMTLVTD